ncbi:hypothetical protein CHL76_14265 [Marinococcus halophilus]|uniref:Nucleotidyltransferase n=1 Tax=Marinococcus halophilus TaxID=1371 RepID=A0A510YC07_MARHA|nr:nucleotidyltransferase [Marinococcus halophilus]OZT79119.1 hypothetical protein CHL76_14265 [Marinococcus halophilus]GEK59897.1 hypothetical protein MHA01_28020 [Marinococcus halophilus]
MATPSSIQESRLYLAQLDPTNKFDTMMKMAGVITKHLEEEGIQPIVVGGLSVELYSREQYTTRDIDFVAPNHHQISRVLDQLGFRSYGKDFYHDELNVSIEVPSTTLTGDPEKIVNLSYEGFTINIIGIEDIIIDRIQHALNTKTTLDLDDARILMITQYDEIDWTYFNVHTLMQEPYSMMGIDAKRGMYWIENMHQRIEQADESDTIETMAASTDIDRQLARGTINVEDL